MEIVFMFTLPALLWTQAWRILGFYSSGRTLGITSAVVAVTLLGVVLMGREIVTGATSHASGTEGPLSALILVWAFYAALLASVELWGFDQRTLGFYSLFLGIVSILFVLYYFLGDAILLDQGFSPFGFASGEVGVISTIMGVFASILAVLAISIFIYLGPPVRAMRNWTGWSMFVFSVVGIALGGLAAMGLPLDR